MSLSLWSLPHSGTCVLHFVQRSCRLNGKYGDNFSWSRLCQLFTDFKHITYGFCKLCRVEVSATKWTRCCSKIWQYSYEITIKTPQLILINTKYWFGVKIFGVPKTLLICKCITEIWLLLCGCDAIFPFLDFVVVVVFFFVRIIRMEGFTRTETSLSRTCCVGPVLYPWAAPPGGTGGQVPRYRKIAGYSTPLSSVRLEADR